MMNQLVELSLFMKDEIANASIHQQKISSFSNQQYNTGLLICTSHSEI